MVFGVTLLQVGSCVTALVCGTLGGGDGHGLSLAFEPFCTHTILVFVDADGGVLT